MLKTKSGKEVSKAGIAGFQGFILDADLVGDILVCLGDISLVQLTERQGITERNLGKNIDSLDREDVFITTGTKKRTVATLKSEFDKSLETIGTDYIDMIEFRNVRPGYDYMSLIAEGGALEGALELKEEGKLGYIGVSTTYQDLAFDLAKLDGLDVLLVPYNPGEVDKEGCYKELEGQVKLIGLSPMGGAICDDWQGLVDFSYQADFLDHVIFRVANIEDMGNLCRLISQSQPLEEGHRQDLVDFFASCDYNFCRQCGSCIPCTVGMDIVTNLLFNLRLKRSDYSVVEDYETMFKNASDCIRCGACELRCPYDVEVRAHHKETVAMVEEYKSEVS